MLESRLDKPTILGAGIPRFKAIALFLAAMILAACATGGRESPENTEPETDLSATLEGDPDVVFHIMAAERLGAVGDYGQALSHYLDAARLSDDPALSEQVTRLGASLGEWPTVTEGARRWRELEPDNQAARQIHVVGLLRQARVEEATAELAEHIENAPDPDSAWREAVNLVASARPDAMAREAFDLLEETTGLAERPADRALQRSRFAWQMEDEAEALVLAEEAASLGDDRTRHVWAAQLAVAAGEPERALEHYRNARALDPEDMELALSEAEVRRRLDDIDGALEVLAEIPDGVEVHYTRGSYLQAAGRREEALAEWHALAAAEDPADTTSHAFYTAYLAELLELNEQALEWYARVEDGPMVPRARLRQAYLEAEAGQLETARERLAALRADGGMYQEQAWLGEAQILQDAGRNQEALDLLSGALTDLPESVSLLYGRAMAAAAVDNLELAEQDLRAIMQIDPGNAVALNALGYTLTDRTDRHNEAYRLIRRAYEMEPDNPAILDSLGWVYFRMGRPADGLPYLREAHEGDRHPEIAAHLGEVLLVLGEEAEGREILRKAREEFPDDEYLAETVKRLGVGR